MNKWQDVERRLAMNYQCVLLDVETQQDFLDPAGSCYTPAAESVRVQLRRLFQWARQYHVPVISTVLRVRTGEHGPLSAVPHCVDGTPGEKKMPETILSARVNLGLRNTTDLPSSLFEDYQQVIFEKRHTDIFLHARAERLITELPNATFVLCGVGLAQGIVQAAVGLRNRGLGVILAEDAVLDLNDPMTEMSRRRMEAKGVIFAPTQKIILPSVVKGKRPAKFRQTHSASF